MEHFKSHSPKSSILPDCDRIIVIDDIHGTGMLLKIF